MGRHQQGHPFFRRYGVNLPSSLTRVLSIALVSSTYLPVSVCGTGTSTSSLRGFSWQFGVDDSAPPSGRLVPCLPPILGISHQDPRLPRDTDHVQSARSHLPSCVPPSLYAGGNGLSTVCPSPTPFGLGLGPPNPERMNLPQEPLGFRRPGFSPELYATHTGILTSGRSSTPSGIPSRRPERSPTTPSLTPKDAQQSPRFRCCA
jgi:hypothetical protein